MGSALLAVLRAIHQSPSTRRREIVERVGLGAPRVSALVSTLLAQGLLIEELDQGGAPGRPAGALRINAGAGRVIGLDVGGHTSRVVVADLAGEVLASLRRPTRAVPDGDVILGDLEALAREACAAAKIAPEQLWAMGLGLRGIVDSATGKVLGWPNTPIWSSAWSRLDLAGELRKRLDLEVIVIEDSVRAMAVNAHRSRSARGQANFLYVFLGSGIGASLFVDGRLYRGAIGLAGELGHVTVAEDGPWCSCGNRGCLEVMANTTAVLQRVERRLRESYVASELNASLERGELTLDALLAAGAAGDKIAYQILDETGNYVGRVLAVALNLFGPELVVIGGPFVRGDGILLEAMQRQVRLRALQYLSGRVRIMADDEGEYAGARGAALLALDALFDSGLPLERIGISGR